MSEAQHLVNGLATNVLQTLDKDNYVIATASLSLILAMAQAATACENRQGSLESQESKAEDTAVHEAMQYTLRLMEGKNDVIGNEVILLQNIWIRSDITLSQKGRNLLATYYSCEANSLPSEKTNANARELKKRLNKLDWSGKFHEHFDAANFHISNQDMLLTSAVHIAMSWREPFSSNFNSKRQFYVSHEESVYVVMMTLKFGLVSVSDDVIRAHVIQLPLTAHNMCVLFYLPYEENGLQFVEQNLTEESFRMVVRKLESAKPTPVDISIPKFTLEQNNNLTKDIHEGTATLGELYSESRTISGCQIFHTVTLTINEQGVNVPFDHKDELMIVGPAVLDGIKWTKFTANHPFLFMLVEMQSKLIVICGKVSTPVCSQETKSLLHNCNYERKRNWCCI